mmetsp:Transcript_14246/g.30793  ORF Transcript_14246/g.30793 Transcript_14246/m.30793 type:complete len:318 (+) Transcript_14246:36-989(+)
MLVKNTFLAFWEEEDEQLLSTPQRRSSSIPPTAKLSFDETPVLSPKSPPICSAGSLSGMSTTSGSTTTSPRDSVGDRDGLSPTLIRLLDRPFAGSTTVMVQNIPNQFTQRLLLRVWREMGFGRCLDLLYLPMDFRKKCNLGYAFVNFCTTDQVEAFRLLIDGTKLPHFKSSKLIVTAEARVQGFAANFDSFRNSLVMARNVAPEYQPMIFDPTTGAEVPFPAPVGQLRSAKIRKGAEERVTWEGLRKRLVACVREVEEPGRASMVIQAVVATCEGQVPALEEVVAKAEQSTEELRAVIRLAEEKRTASLHHWKPCLA